MTESQGRDLKYAAVGGVALVITIAAWPFLRNALSLLRTVGGLGASIASKTDAVLRWASGSCGLGQGDCQTPAAEAQKMHDRLKSCSLRAAATRTQDQGGALNPCFPDTDHTDLGVNFVHDPTATANVPVALPPSLRQDGFAWGPRFQFQLNGWRAALKELGVLQLYAGPLTPQCAAFGRFIQTRAMGATGQYNDDAFIQTPCNSVYWNGGADPKPFEAEINAWLQSQGF